MPPLTQQSLNGDTYWEARIGDVGPDTPIALMLHYMTGDASSLSIIFDDVSRPLRLIALQGQYPSGDLELGGYSWFPDEGAWYDRPQAAQAPDIRQQADRIAAFLRAFKTRHTAKTVVVGMSQGGDLTLSLAAYHPELIDLAVACAGRLSPSMRPRNFHLSSPLPVVYLKHGEADEVVPVETSREAAAWLQAVGYQVSLQEYPGVGHTLSAEQITDIRQAVQDFLA